VTSTAQERLGPLAGRTIVTGVAGDDIHVMGIRLVEHALRSAGANVVSLAVVLSSSNGHAAISCDGMREAFIEAGLGEVLLYIGGNLNVGRAASFDDVERRFKILGFDRVFAPRADLDVALDLIASDINSKGQ